MYRCFVFVYTFEGRNVFTEPMWVFQEAHHCTYYVNNRFLLIKAIFMTFWPTDLIWCIAGLSCNMSTSVFVQFHKEPSSCVTLWFSWLDGQANLCTETTLETDVLHQISCVLVLGRVLLKFKNDLNVNWVPSVHGICSHLKWKDFALVAQAQR